MEAGAGDLSVSVRVMVLALVCLADYSFCFSSSTYRIVGLLMPPVTRMREFVSAHPTTVDTATLAARIQVRVVTLFLFHFTSPRT